MTDFKELQKEVYETVRSKGFYDKWNRARTILFKEGWKENLDWLIYLAELELMDTEISEAAEEVRNGDMDKVIKELAGLIIRVMSFCENLGVNLETVIILENERNKTRPINHGRKVI